MCIGAKSLMPTMAAALASPSLGGDGELFKRHYIYSLNLSPLSPCLLLSLCVSCLSLSVALGIVHSMSGSLHALHFLHHGIHVLKIYYIPG